MKIGCPRLFVRLGIGLTTGYGPSFLFINTMPHP